MNWSVVASAYAGTTNLRKGDVAGVYLRKGCDSTGCKGVRLILCSPKENNWIWRILNCDIQSINKSNLPHFYNCRPSYKSFINMNAFTVTPIVKQMPSPVGSSTHTQRHSPRREDDTAMTSSMRLHHKLIGPINTANFDATPSQTVNFSVFCLLIKTLTFCVKFNFVQSIQMESKHPFDDSRDLLVYFEKLPLGILSYYEPRQCENVLSIYCLG